ncbi:hypothetical protein N865_15130 [Intrasporangium oryzae NRRL B-24470]|uniref:DUF2252 domain-containing protein n=1 Tax=Intrasporangium oryzae NRRL B-24470 TaxID=1386089 RepID=W9G6J3_9MICO|nr:DUF2252 domain-containing protein [Intrasporangium oryzae]EWT01620.1 hypothetical protein N865_15130 [Intrasporangium oryzae NRRL B-24470]
MGARGGKSGTAGATEQLNRPGGGAGHAPRPDDHPGPEERVARGLAARSAVPPGELGDFEPAADRPGVADVLADQARTRVPELVPIRHARMAVSPFTFFRGHAKGMAIDLAPGPVSGISVQLCGDAHLSNFGVFASPERHLLFDVNDFDETHPGPWEWDVMRLVASIAVAGRANGFSGKQRRACVLGTAERYREAMAQFAGMRFLDVWYSHADVDELRGEVLPKLSAKRRQTMEKNLGKARSSGNLKALAKLTELVDGELRLRSDPPLMVPLGELLPEDDRADLVARMLGLLQHYRGTLPSDRRMLFDRFEFLDIARKVVGVGSVGTRCWVVLLRGRDDQDPLFLQVKEAEASVLEAAIPAAMRPAEPFGNQGERVVKGQRLMQAASDIFLGWQRVDQGIDGVGRDFYVRQLRDMKGSALIDQMNPPTMTLYGQYCAWTLARAHARSGDDIAIAAYLGDDDGFATAMARFAETYADQTERDHAAFVDAIGSGRLPAAASV